MLNISVCFYISVPYVYPSRTFAGFGNTPSHPYGVAPRRLTKPPLTNPSPLSIFLFALVFENGTASVSDTAERFGYDTSTVSSILRGLAEAGFLERETVNLSAEDGTDEDSDEGEVEIYEAESVEETHRSETVGFFRWVGEAYGFPKKPTG